MNIVTIKQNITEKHALEVVKSRSKDLFPVMHSKVYYPYYWFHFSCTVKTLLGSKSIKASCLTDLCRNQAFTTDYFEKENLEEDSTLIVQDKYSECEAYKTARTYVVHSSIHLMKALLLPEVSLIEKERVYKLFWLVECQQQRSALFLILVDSTTGKYEILPD